MSDKILITGATGNIAGLLIPGLQASGASIRGLVRNPEKAVALKDAGIEVVEGDFANIEALDKAVDGVDTIVLITAPNPDAAIQASNVLAAAKRAGSPRIVRISALKATAEGPTDNSRQHAKTDPEIQESGLPYTIIRPHFFMQNLFMSAETIGSDGVMYWGMGEGHLGMVDVRDIADFTLKVITEEGHNGKMYTITGPTPISFHDAAKALSTALGKEVNYVAVPLEAVTESILSMGMGEWFAQVMTDYSRAYSEGWGDFTTDDFKSVTGKSPRSIEAFASEVFAPAMGA